MSSRAHGNGEAHPESWYEILEATGKHGKRIYELVRHDPQGEGDMVPALSTNTQTENVGIFLEDARGFSDSTGFPIKDTAKICRYRGRMPEVQELKKYLI